MAPPLQLPVVPPLEVAPVVKELATWWLLLISNASFQAAFKVALPTWFSEMVMASLPVVPLLEVAAVGHQHSAAHGGQPMTWQGRHHCG